MFNRGYDVSIKHSKNNPSQDDHVIVEAYLPTPNEWIIFVSQIREYYDPLMTKEELLNLHLF
jgi:hypothetical protein